MDDFDVTKVNFSGLDLGESAFQSAFNSLVGELEDLETKLNQKTAIWEGGAREAYNVTRATWQTEAKGLADIVSMMAKNINITRMNMQDVERINTAMFDGR
ncbi:WXG100 family type VII secretion target [Streptosporangium amethystogenes subsp. fukuiense]|uniref:WXG100 family type VII secretion target n=1 Tax=Streptosporangium amethystogenes subsp. fukuiense TaxID=698418 RepID=A0ABW2TCB4_9ACTN